MRSKIARLFNTKKTGRPNLGHLALGLSRYTDFPAFLVLSTSSTIFFFFNWYNRYFFILNLVTFDAYCESQTISIATKNFFMTILM